MTETIDPMAWSYQGSSLTFVPNPLPPLQPNTPLLNEQQLDNPTSSSSSGVNLISKCFQVYICNFKLITLSFNA